MEKQQSLNNDMYRRFEALLGCSVTDRHIDWERLLRRIESRITSAEKIGVLAIIKQNEIPDEEKLESVECALQKRIFEYIEYESPINECIRAQENLPNNQWERIESKLSTELDALDVAEAWNAVVKQEQILPAGDWEKIELSLLERIGSHESAARTKVSWPLWWLFQKHYHVVASVALVCIISLAGIAGYLFLNSEDVTLPTYVYHAQGSDFDLVGNSLISDYLRSSRDGSIRLVNKHGFACLQNGAALQVDEMNETAARYRVVAAADSGGTRDGKATFFVKPRPNNRRFTVSTPDYDISVLGTYFTVYPDLLGRMSTQVLEGKVRIKSGMLGDTVIHAGQTLVFNREKNEYVIRGNGPIVSRSEIEAMPNVESIDEYQAVTFSSNIAYADVAIDGKNRGPTPLRVLLPQGKHSVRISKNDYVAIDTVITIGEVEAQALYAILKAPQPVLSRIPTEKKQEMEPEKKKSISSDTIKKLLVQDPAIHQAKTAKDLLQEAQVVEVDNWVKALEVYKEIMSMEHVPSLIRESALFSIGRIKLEKQQAKKEAREAFLGYLALHPDGLFARESLLRLAELEFEYDQNKAIEYYLKYFEKYPNHYRVSDLQYRVGLIYLQKEKYDEAVYMIKQSLANMVHSQPIERERRNASLYKALVAKGDTANAELVGQK